MFIQDIKIQDLGSVRHYEAHFTPELNFIENHCTAEIAAALAFLLCSKAEIPAQWLQESTYISANIRLSTVYTVCAKPLSGQLQLSVVDPTGADFTEEYQYILSHCQEQDAIEAFDGENNTLPFRLCSYRNRESHRILSPRTRRLTDTGFFRKHLWQYIHAFRPEPINCNKNYQTAINARGIFEVIAPGVNGNVFLSETEQKLFLYICFLNIAEFWAGVEKTRDLHHEKKPLLIRNFIEFLDQSTNIDGLIARTRTLHRQILILTSPLNPETKKKWMG